MDTRLLLITLLIKLGVAAAVATALVRAREFQKLIFREQRGLKEQVYLTLAIATPFALGVVIRFSVHNFQAADLAFEAALLIGVMEGRSAGALGGVLLGIPALVNGEWMSMPFDVMVGILAGALRHLAEDREAIWDFSPFIDISLYRWIKRNFKKPRLEWQIAFFLLILLLSLLRMELMRAFPAAIFGLTGKGWLLKLAIVAVAVMCVAIPLKIWNNTRIELKLEEQERRLLQARMEALQSQINPHFLFNTLNSISSLVRFDPDTARDMIVKLASILRRLLRKTDAFVQLRDEVEFIDDYLDIEVVRFGREKLFVRKELDPASLDVMVPSMLLQPLVENSIKHGLSPKIDGGSIALRSRVRDGSLWLEVEDDGVGMGSAQILEPPTGIGGTGIGLANVAERLKVLYGDSAHMVIDAGTQGGTLVKLQLPLLAPGDIAPEPAPILYDARSSTSR